MPGSTPPSLTSRCPTYVPSTSVGSRNVSRRPPNVRIGGPGQAGRPPGRRRPCGRRGDRGHRPEGLRRPVPVGGTNPVSMFEGPLDRRVDEPAGRGARSRASYGGASSLPLQHRPAWDEDRVGPCATSRGRHRRSPRGREAGAIPAQSRYGEPPSGRKSGRRPAVHARTFERKVGKSRAPDHLTPRSIRRSEGSIASGARADRRGPSGNRYRRPVRCP